MGRLRQSVRFLEDAYVEFGTARLLLNSKSYGFFGFKSNSICKAPFEEPDDLGQHISTQREEMLL